MSDLQVTPAAEWRRGWEGVTKRLPSGRIARLRDVNLDLLVRLGRIPDALTPLVIDVFTNGGDLELPDVQNLEDMQARLQLRDEVVRCAFVEPRIVDDPQAANEIPLEAVEARDRWFVFQVLSRPVEDLESFRAQQEGVVDAVDTPADNGPASESTAEPAPVGKRKTRA